ncbi:hypothetical protein GCM10010174_81530 [Kutzneria viridogrisea]|uniref:Integral membrane protein n=2 Tax=Kutzneria TaxID=43356 RepID=W5WH14_9PSEU|nr:hypothetical protein [Kutzneria albida]AHI00041.1 hypothetical protein KALB_6682 [Kutzneria albida DSM 43870]MBA8925220.1 hypothetical protein [Kutzneria viridogrisea]
MTAGTTAPGRARINARTLRTDRWWVQPAVTVLVLVAFIIYATVRAFANGDYYAAPYISPFYSPCLAANCVPGSSEVHLLGSWWALSPALLILVFPLGFRLTCYYYRKAYYRGFWASPPACAVAEPHGKYTGERRFPLVLNNLHRYFFYIGLVFNVILTYDAVIAFRDADGNWGHMGMGTLVLLANAALLWLYSLSCHSCRHAMGGRLTHFSKHPVRYKAWTLVSRLNTRHMLFAWLSLFGVALADLYVALVASGALLDVKFF